MKLQYAIAMLNVRYVAGQKQDQINFLLNEQIWSELPQCLIHHTIWARLGPSFRGTISPFS